MGNMKNSIKKGIFLFFIFLLLINQILVSQGGNCLVWTRQGNDSYVINNNGIPLAIFTDEGDIKLNGFCEVKPICSYGIFEVRGIVGQTVASVDSSGNLCLISGDCSSDTSCNDGIFSVKKNSVIKSSINNSGVLCFTGNLVFGHEICWNISTEKTKQNGFGDEDRNCEADYDSQSGFHGDQACPIRINGISIIGGFVG